MLELSEITLTLGNGITLKVIGTISIDTNADAPLFEARAMENSNFFTIVDADGRVLAFVDNTGGIVTPGVVARSMPGMPESAAFLIQNANAVNLGGIIGDGSYQPPIISETQAKHRTIFVNPAGQLCFKDASGVVHSLY